MEASGMAQKLESSVTKLDESNPSDIPKGCTTQNVNQGIPTELPCEDSELKCKGKLEIKRPEYSLQGESSQVNKTAEINLSFDQITCQPGHLPSVENSACLFPHTEVSSTLEPTKVGPNTTEKSDSNKENSTGQFSEPSVNLCNSQHFKDLQKEGSEVEIAVLSNPSASLTSMVQNDKSSDVTCEIIPNEAAVEILGDIAETNKKHTSSHQPSVTLSSTDNKPYSFGNEVHSDQDIKGFCNDSIPQPEEDKIAENVTSVGSQELMINAELHVTSPEVHLEPYHNILKDIVTKETVEATEIGNTSYTVMANSLMETEAYIGAGETFPQLGNGSCSSIMAQIVLSSLTNEDKDGFPFVESDNEIDGEDDVACGHTGPSPCDMSEGKPHCPDQSPEHSNDTSVDNLCNDSSTFNDSNINDSKEPMADENTSTSALDVAPCEQPPIPKRPRLLGQSEDSDDHEDSSPDDGSATLLQALPTESAKPWPIIPIPPCRQEDLGNDNMDNSDGDDDGSDPNQTTRELGDVGKSLVEACDQLVPEDVCHFHNSGSSFYSDAQLEKPKNWNEPLSAKISTPISDQIIPHLSVGSSNVSCFNNIHGRDYLVKREPLYPTKKQHLRLGLSKKQRVRSLHGN